MIVITEEQFADMQDSWACGEKPPSVLIIRNGKDYDDYIDKIAEADQMSRFRISYNHSTFNGASSLVSVADLLLNPWYKVLVPQPVLPQYTKSIWQASQHLQDEGSDEALLPDEQSVADKLPNGWTSEMGFTYNITPYFPERILVRPNANLLLSKYMIINGYCILHPWLKRALNTVELNAILNCDFVPWMQSWVDGLTVSEEMIRYVCDLNFTVGPVVANPHFAKPTFDWRV